MSPAVAMSKSNPSVTPKIDGETTPSLPPCNVPYRHNLHIGRCVSAYFDPQQPPAVWNEHDNPYVQIIYIGAGSDCTVHWDIDGVWTHRQICTPFFWVIGAGVTHKMEWRQPALRLAIQIQPTYVAEFAGQDVVGSNLIPVGNVESCNPKILECAEDFEHMEPSSAKISVFKVESLATLMAMRIFESWVCLIRGRGPIRLLKKSVTG